MKRSLLLALMACAMALPILAQPKIVAHRGYWRSEGSAQNSLTSLIRADQVGCYGSEFDVWITSDGVPVVFHDAVVQGIRIEDAAYKDLQLIQLNNGEFIPTLQQYLQLGKMLPELQLILEIKPHSTPDRDDKVTEMVVKLIKQLGLEKQTEYISFSRRACQRLHELVPEAKNAYLSGDLSPKEAQELLGCNGIDYNEGVFQKHPEWLKEAAQSGMEVNVWTVDGEENLRKHVNTPGIDIITTNDPEILKNIILKK